MRYQLRPPCGFSLHWRDGLFPPPLRESKFPLAPSVGGNVLKIPLIYIDHCIRRRIKWFPTQTVLPWINKTSIMIWFIRVYTKHGRPWKHRRKLNMSEENVVLSWWTHIYIYIYVDKADVFGRIGCRFCDGMGRIFREQGAEDMISSRGMAFRCLFHKSSVWYGTAQFPLVRGGGGGRVAGIPRRQKKGDKTYFFFCNKQE